MNADDRPVMSEAELRDAIAAVGRWFEQHPSPPTGTDLRGGALGFYSSRFVSSGRGHVWKWKPYWWAGDCGHCTYRSYAVSQVEAFYLLERHTRNEHAPPIPAKAES